MNALLSVRQFLNDMRRQKLRSAMTMFGIFWGTCSIVLLFAFGQGITEAQLKSQRGLGENIAIFWPGITNKEYQGLPKGRRIRPTEEDCRYLQERATTIAHISPENGRQMYLQYGANKSRRLVIGVWPEFGPMRNLVPLLGSRFINQLDVDERKRVIFLGNEIRKELFGGEEEPVDDDDAVGRQILVNGVPYTVVGIMKPKEQDSSYRGRDSRNAFIPLTTYQAIFSERWADNVVVQCKPEFTGRDVEREVFNLLGAKYKFDPTDDEALGVWDTTEGFAFLRNFFMAFQWFLVGIGFATLITGGIGVTNIMNVVLEERTKEIGIKMALGARQSTILWQFIMETLVITGVGGVLGFLFAAALIALVPELGLEDYIGTPRVNLLGAAVVTLLLGMVGLIAGLFPARRAARLQPVQALKLF